jgi:hypothetical protein
MNTGWPFFKPQYAERASLHRVIAGRILIGIQVDEDNLLLRFMDSTLCVNLKTRMYKFQPVFADWMTLPDLLLVTQVIEDQHQVILETSGGSCAAHIEVREIGREWRITLQSWRNPAYT